MGDRMSTVGQEGHPPWRGQVRQEILIPPLNTSGSCGVGPHVYAHHSCKSSGVASTTTTITTTTTSTFSHPKG